jgi:hypothetical protein
MATRYLSSIPFFGFFCTTCSDFDRYFVGILTQIVALANLIPLDDSVDELDSYMYQTVSSFSLVFL